MRKIPISVRIVMVIAWVAGVFNIIIGLSATWASGQSLVGPVQGNLFFVAAICIGFGLTYAIAPISLGRVSRPARVGITCIAVANLLWWGIASWLTDAVTGGKVQIDLTSISIFQLLAIAIVMLLWLGPARKHFRRQPRQPDRDPVAHEAASQQPGR